MKHSEYNELTRRLSFYSREADRTRKFMADPGGTVIWRSVNEADTDLSRWMDERANGWIESNQERADKGFEMPTADFRALYDAMVGFMSATEKTDPRGVLYEKTRNRCQAWIDQAVTWFPVLNPFIYKLLNDEQYKKAVKYGDITPPFTWNGSIKDLAYWLDDNFIVDGDPVNDDVNVTKRTNIKWSQADRVFRIKGKRITGRQLNEAYNP